MGNIFCCCCRIRDGGKKHKVPATTRTPYIEYQKPATIRNEVNLRKETLRLRPDPENPGQLLVSFSFDATVPARNRITLVFFAEEDSQFNLTATKGDTLPLITFDFEKEGLGQKYVQPSGTGVDLSLLEDSELFKEEVGTCIYPLAVKMEAAAAPEEGKSTNAQITQLTFVKEKGEVKIRVVKQLLWVNGARYELQDIYGTDQGKECVVCLSEPRDTIVLPCRHMCMCSGCAKALRFQKNECPVCRQPAERLMELEGNGYCDGDKHI
uniref:RING-type E3 ubiquitin transferase n=1 Tax=Brassica campestris TaxID=3711 RepID=A0A3P5ZUX2_BRACM|nr:unnamed protein product [Brassica rapa]